MGVEPTMTVTFDGNVLSKPEKYVDWKDDSAKGTNNPTFNYPSATYAYDVTNYVNASNIDTYYVTVANTKAYNGNDPSTTGDDKKSFNIQAIGLLTLYNESGSKVYDYWVDEGCDLTYLKCTDNSATPIVWQDNRKPSDTKCWANFSNVDNSSVSSVTLITVAPSAGTEYNQIYLNSDPLAVFSGLWDGNPRDKDFSWDDTADVKDFLLNGQNYAIFHNGLDDDNSNTDGQMQAANAFLLVNKTA
ncbi:MULTISPECIES: DUF3344 domain-containing protein [unclassified Methanosarcina]|uniref:DUF3344 domain-containing protein n=1 Tax=unclassified Methanosarcina TaxID=2644672 RepID=UPI002100E8E3|nr:MULTISPECIES: DUF3344 domain-containing protein [unclassified Methanosarcina]